MELNREHFRAMIFYDFRRGLSQEECINPLNLTFGDEVPSKTTVDCWFSEFNLGRSSLSDEFREGRPKSTVVPENIDAV
ncbi:histone-lysine N-methyltransferase SETMAR-like [Rhynchophorus ferrugineus]|uniref:histone-lysine N-methyltransferase SETMAR-like n=1 Tax=Rhynchophorus ferrugineus TaxID=354439 RepID=UPI003FCC5B8B